MRILVTMPRYGRQASFGAVDAFTHPLRDDSKHRLAMLSRASSALTANFNEMWAVGLDAYEEGKIDAFAMIHSDVSAEYGWLDILADELESHGADVVSAAIPIKDLKGLTSTAVDDSGDPWRPRRLTLHELQKMPRTFGDAEAGGPILLNTGLWLCKLGPWCLAENADGTARIRFDCGNEIRRGPDGRRRAWFEPEDWKFSRDVRAAGLKIMATQAVAIEHDGELTFPNRGGYAMWQEDLQNGPKANWRQPRPTSETDAGYGRNPSDVNDVAGMLYPREF